MADHLTEEEQIEALKNWWKEYWMSIVLPILLIAAGYFGWTTHQANKEQQAKQGSLAYQELVSVVGSGAELSQEQQNEARLAAQTLIDEFGGTLYADRAKLVLARFAVESGELENAKSMLQEVADGGANPAIKNVALTRLAKVCIAQGNYDKAISLMGSANDDSFKSIFAEIRGDALAAKGDVAAATTAYQEALDNLGQQYARRGLIDLKLKGVALIASAASGVSAAPEAAEAPAAAEAAVPATENTESEDALAGEGNS